MVVAAATGKRKRDGRAKMAKMWVHQDAVDAIVGWLDGGELAWVRGVCRGLRAAAERVHRLRHAGKAPAPRLALTWAGAGRGAGRMQEALRTWVKPMHARNEHVACEAAATAGCLDALVAARANGAPWDSWTCAHAAENGHLAVLQWIHVDLMASPCAGRPCEWAREHRRAATGEDE